VFDNPENQDIVSIEIQKLFQECSLLITELCVLRMDVVCCRDDIGRDGREQPVSASKALKSKEAASLLFALIWACLLMCGRVLRRFGFCEANSVLFGAAAPTFSHGGARARRRHT